MLKLYFFQKNSFKLTTVGGGGKKKKKLLAIAFASKLENLFKCFSHSIFHPFQAKTKALEQNCVRTGCFSYNFLR